MPSPIEPLREWSDFFTTIGTAAGALVGATFIVASISVGFLTRDRTAATNAFMTSTVVHFSAVMLGSVLTMIPVLSIDALGAIFVAGGVIGLVYAIAMAVVVRRYESDWTDRVWYAAAPILGYALVVASGAVSLAGIADRGIELLALALVMLTLSGIRNAWDMIIFIVSRDKSKG
jgi:hypothetical protein